MNLKIYAYIVILAMLCGAGYTLGKHVHKSGYASGMASNAALVKEMERKERLSADAYNQSVISAIAEQDKALKKYQTAENKANELQKQLQASRVQSNDIIDRLRITTDQNKTRMSEASTDAINEYAAILSTVVTDCAAKYSELAISYRQSSIEQERLIDSW